MLYEKIRKLCKEKGVTVTEVERELGFGRGSLSKIDKHKPSNEKKLEKYLVENLKELAFADISVKDKRKATNYEKKIANTEKKISRLKELYLNELITLDDYKHDLATYKADIDTFKAEARKYRGTDKKALYNLVGRNLADWYWTLSEDERRVIWRSVIDQIYFDNDKNIKIVFR